MSKITLVIATLLSVNAFAVQVPPCWTEQVPTVEDGKFLVGFRPEKGSKEDVVKFLAAAKKSYLSITDTITMTDGSLVITYKAAVTGGIDRQALKDAVNKELEPLASVPGVYVIQCNNHYKLGGGSHL